MRVLAFDTATALTAVALCDVEIGGPAGTRKPRAGLDLAAVDEPPLGARPGHAGRLLALVHQLLGEAQVTWPEIDVIAVGVGPGTFTGMRIGIATAQALAASADRPLVGVSTLRSLALAAHEQEPGLATLAVIDARRHEVFVAGWAAGQSPASGEPALAPRVLAPEQLPRLLQGGATQTLAVGDGALKFADELRAAGAVVPEPDSPLHRVSARGHCRLAPLVAPSPNRIVEPDYLRVPDAELLHR